VTSFIGFADVSGFCCSVTPSALGKPGGVSCALGG